MAKWNLVNSLKGKKRSFSLKNNVEALGRVQKKVGDVSADVFCGSCN